MTDWTSWSVDEAQRATGITPVQVSRWRKHLSDKQKYRDKEIVPV